MLEQRPSRVLFLLALYTRVPVCTVYHINGIKCIWVDHWDDGLCNPVLCCGWKLFTLIMFWLSGLTKARYFFFGMGGQWFCTRDSPCPSSPYSQLVYILGENDRFGDLWVHLCFLIHYSDSMGCSLPGSSIHGILQARMLEWVALSYSRGSFRSKIVIGPLGKPRLGDGFSQTNRCQSVLIIGFLSFFLFFFFTVTWRFGG